MTGKHLIGHVKGMLGRPLSILRAHVRTLRRGWHVPIAQAWRRLLDPAFVVGVTGSAGKSTTVGLIGEILAARGQTRVSREKNTPRAVATTILRARRSDKYLVQEVSGHGEGEARRSCRLLRHNVAVVTRVEFDHIKAFGGNREAIAQEKSALVELLPADGIAVLNADDPLVLAMRSRTRARVVTFGNSPDADVRVLGVDFGGLPARLSLTVTAGGSTAHVRTLLVGERWASSVLAAIACGWAMGFDLDDCARAISGFEPRHCRDSVHDIGNGSLVALDWVNAPNWTFPTSIEIVASAKVSRRTMIVGTISDYSGTSRKKYVDVAKAAMAVSDRVIFYGPQSGRVLRLLEANEGRLWTFENVTQINDFLEATAVPGELIYVKASGIDHLERLLYNRRAAIDCWLDGCRKNFSCDFCKRLYVHGRTRKSGFRPEGPADAPIGQSATSA